MKRVGLGILGVLLCAGVSVLGCGDDASSTGSGPTITQVPAMLAPVVCDQLLGCVGKTFLAGNQTSAQCTDQVLAQLQDKTFFEISAAIDAGTVKYHADQVADCITALSQLGCQLKATRLRDVAACDGVFEGTIAVGHKCDVNEQCTGDAFCKQGSKCPGTCTQQGSAGASCEQDDDCKNHLVCNSDNKCEKPALVGEVCGVTGKANCDLGLVCVDGDTKLDKAGKCKAIADSFKGKSGDSCDLAAAHLCTPDLACIVSIENKKPVYTCSEKVKSKASCNFGVPGQCPSNEYCDADVSTGVVAGKCQPLPKGGEACLSSGSSSGALPVCAPGFTCSSEMRCRKLGRNGDACAVDTDCASQNCDADKCAKPAVCKI